MAWTQLPLLLFAFFAGFVDSVVGGGGLIQTPALLLFLPQFPVATIFGTNKLVSICGTSMATVQYTRRIKIPWLQVLVTAGTAFVFSWIGAQTVSSINTQYLRPMIVVLLVIIAGFIIIKKDFGSMTEAEYIPNKSIGWGIAMGAGLGFYDGFFGPGTGTFLIFGFILWLKFNFLQASASAKVINLATNLAAVIYFGLGGHILYHIALPMAICNVAGAFLGSRLAILRGNRFVRWIFLVVVTGIILKLLWDTFQFLFVR
jgi:uncharacterized protein